MKDLTSIDNFGAIDADNDDLLATCFEDHDAFLSLLNFERFVVIGRKGSGKTAIFKKFIENAESDYFCFGHTFSDYPWHLHDAQVCKNIPEEEKFIHSWKYLILLTISKIILNQDQSLPYDDNSMDALAKIERFVVDSYGTRDPDVTQIFTPSKTLHLHPTIAIDTKLLKAGISPELVPMSELPTVISEVNRNLTEYVTNSLSPKNRYYICFDQLDLGFNPEDANYSSRLIGLLLACRDINIRARKSGKRLSVCIFLRDDIYGNLSFEDKNKITENFLSLIEWDTPRTQKTLKKLMEKRFAQLLKDEKSTIIGWDDVFDETKEMTGHQSKYQHILDRTYLRPRDIIMFCNKALDQYKIRMASEEARKKDSKIDNIDINEAKPLYSDYFMKELDDEIHKHIPKYKDFLEIFKLIGVVQFSIEEFEDAFEKKKVKFSSIADPRDILKMLFQFSVVGFYRAGGAGYGGSKYIFKYQDSRAQFDETAQRFKLHSGLIDVLGLKKYLKK